MSYNTTWWQVYGIPTAAAEPQASRWLAQMETQI